MGEGIMFYCDPCAEEKGWPESFHKTHGTCEVCGKTAVCNDVHHDHLSVDEAVSFKKKANVGGHWYPGCEDDDNFFTSDCEHGCGCWMGSSNSGGPKGVDQFGACPENPGVDCKKPTPFQEALGADTQEEADQKLMAALMQYTWGGGCNDCGKRITVIDNELIPGTKLHCPYCGSENTSVKLIDQKAVLPVNRD
jgi:DNA-directed RNA polymerase subunit RPC12/RpoP